MRNSVVKSSVLALLLVFLTVWVYGSPSAKTQLPTSENIIKASKEVLPTVVSIRITKQIGKVEYKILEPKKSRPEELPEPFKEWFERFFEEPLLEQRDLEVPAAGSGVIISSDGYVLTNDHVIADAKPGSIKITLNDGQEFKGDEVEVIGQDSRIDLAVLKIPATELKTASWGNSDELEIGEWVLAVGNPFELRGSVTQGIVSAKHRVVGRAIIEDLIQTTAVINPGSSGGPLVNLDGQVVGISMAIATGVGVWQGVGFAIPSNKAQEISQQLIEQGKVSYGWLGVLMQDLESEVASVYGLESTTGAFIMGVMEDSPAEAAGIEPYDIIIKIDDQNIKDTKHLQRTIVSKSVGDEAKITLDRLVGNKHKEMFIEVTLAEWPETIEVAGPAPRIEKARRYDKLGLLFREPAETGARELIVEKVKSKSLAEKAGIRAGDIVLEVNKRQVDTLNEYKQALQEGFEGGHLFKIQRGNTVRIIVVKRP